jgi:hypothetical protein
MTALPFILVGTGARARALWNLARRSPKFECVAAVSRSGKLPPGWNMPAFERLEEALAAFPAAAVVGALPPISNLEVALTAAAANRTALVEAPLALRLAQSTLPAGASRVQVDHGWVTLPGRKWLEKVISAQGRNLASCRLSIDVRGMPAAAGGDAEEVLVHALALGRRLLPDVAVESAHQTSESTIESLLRSARGPSIRVRSQGHNHGLQVELDGPGVRATWRWEDGQETVQLRANGSQTMEKTVAAPSPEERALHQLLSPETAGGDSLVDAFEVAKLARATLEALPARQIIGMRPLNAAARIRLMRPKSIGEPIGLVGPLPEAAPAEEESPALPSELTELWPYRAGIKPVAFLTVRPEQVEEVSALFPGAHVERRDRRVLVGVQDLWVDRRSEGEPRAELYISKEPALAQEAAQVQAETDPSKSLRRMGQLMGYPACCVEAFARQDDRANNSRNRYASFARTSLDAKLPWELNNLFGMIVPFYPCRYDCPAALEWARRVLREMEKAYPGTTERVQRQLARPVLYFDHEHQISLDAKPTDDGWDVARAFVPPGTEASFAAFAGALAGARVRWLDDRMEIERASDVKVLRRTDPPLGFLAPFQ